MKPKTGDPPSTTYSQLEPASTSRSAQSVPGPDRMGIAASPE